MQFGGLWRRGVGGGACGPDQQLQFAAAELVPKKGILPCGKKGVGSGWHYLWGRVLLVEGLLLAGARGVGQNGGCSSWGRSCSPRSACWCVSAGCEGVCMPMSALVKRGDKLQRWSSWLWRLTALRRAACATGQRRWLHRWAESRQSLPPYPRPLYPHPSRPPRTPTCRPLAPRLYLHRRWPAASPTCLTCIT